MIISVAPTTKTLQKIPIFLPATRLANRSRDFHEIKSLFKDVQNNAKDARKRIKMIRKAITQTLWLSRFG